MQFERRAIEELVTMYELEPTIRDVYVEGSLDEALIKWFLIRNRALNVTVTVIDGVEVPPSLILDQGLENNNRGRVITFAVSMEHYLGADSVSVTCLADADFDRVLDKNNDCRLLLLTDYSSMELYFFDVRHLTKFLQLVVRKFPKSASDVIVEIQEPLKDLFAIRMAKHVLGWNLPLIPFEGCCELTKQGVRLKVTEYVNRCLNAGDRYSDRKQFEKTYSECREKLQGDPRHCIQGHDLLHLLAWYIRQHKGKNLSKETIERSFFACVELSSLGKELMFQRLLERTNNV